MSEEFFIRYVNNKQSTAHDVYLSFTCIYYHHYHLIPEQQNSR